MRKVSELFNVYSWSKLDFSKQQLDENWINFVSRNSNNNWIVGKVVLEESMKVFQKWDISVPLWGAFLLSAFVQQEDFVTAQNVSVLRPKQSMTELEKWFYCYALRLNRPKFVAFGREVNKYISDIELPDTIPDWVYKANISEIITNNKSWKFELQGEERKKFRVWDVLEYSTTKLSIKDDLDIWEIPLISRTAMNNWCDWYFDIEKSKITKKWCITIWAEWIYAFYQPEDFWTGNKVYTLKNEKLNKYSALFICTILNKEDYKYSYWRARILSKIIDEIIKLPVDKSWNPNREFMENYIKNLPYWDRI